MASLFRAHVLFFDERKTLISLAKVRPAKIRGQRVRVGESKMGRPTASLLYRFWYLKYLVTVVDGPRLESSLRPDGNCWLPLVSEHQNQLPVRWWFADDGGITFGENRALVGLQCSGLGSSHIPSRPRPSSNRVGGPEVPVAPVIQVPISPPLPFPSYP